MMLTVDVMKIRDQCEMAGCDVTYDREAGTVVAMDGEVKVFAAIQKGRDQPWIAIFRDSDVIKWGEPMVGPTL
jgi:hypothetical protein